MQNQKLELIAIKTPSIVLTVYATLIMIAFTNNQIGSAIFLDKLILLIMILLSLSCIIGLAVSIIALFKVKAEKTAVSAAILNVALIIMMIWMSKSFVVELKMTFMGL